MTKEYTCIECPNSCNISLQLNGNEIFQMDGAGCKRGEEYVRQETLHPMRMVTSFVQVLDGEEPVVSVRLDKKVDKDKIFDVMNVLKSMKVPAPVQIGQILNTNILGADVSVIATKSVQRID